MPKATFIVFSNPASAGDEDAYNDWYDNVHVPDVTSIPGIVSARRFRAYDGRPRLEGEIGKYDYLAIYELDTDDLDATFAALTEASRGGTFVMSDTLGRDPKPATGVFVQRS